MSTPRIYADFNGLVRGPENPERTAVVLDTFGSLRDLANAGLILKEGLPLIAFDLSDETQDLEGHGSAQFDRDNNWWVVEFDSEGVRYVQARDRTPADRFLCVRCREPLDISNSRDAFKPGATCPACGTAVLAPFDKPEK